MTNSKIFKIEDGMLTMFDWNEFKGNVAGVATAYDYEFMREYEYDVEEFEEADVVVECANPLSMRKFIALCYSRRPGQFHAFLDSDSYARFTDRHGYHLSLPMLTSEDCSIVHVSKIVVERVELVVNGECRTIFNCQQRYYFKAECSRELCRVQVQWNVVQDQYETSVVNGRDAIPHDLRPIVLR